MHCALQIVKETIEVKHETKQSLNEYKSQSLLRRYDGAEKLLSKIPDSKRVSEN